MADDDSGEKTEEPTAKKLEDARKKGQIARSKELGTMFVLMGSGFALIIMGNSLVEGLTNIMRKLFSPSRHEMMNLSALFKLVGTASLEVVQPLIWIFVIISVAAFIGNTMLGGINFSWDAMMPKWSKLSPIAGVKRILGVQALVEFIKSILKFFVVFLVSILLLVSLFDDILSLSKLTIPNNFSESVDLLLFMFLVLASSLAIIAVIDAPYQVWNHNRQLKMSLKDIKDENKDAEGSPETKGRIRRAQYEMSQRRMMADVKDADVIITNPTHFSIGLQYDTEKGGAPKLIAKGVDEMAIHIRTIAKEHDVEIITSPALARSIYYTTELQEEIPEELFAAVAQILAFVYQLNLYRKGKAKKPKPIAKNLPIPEAYRY